MATRRFSGRGLLGAPLAALMALPVSAALLGASPAGATPTVDEAASFARREITRLCDDARLTEFDRLDEGVYRTCTAQVQPGRLSLDLRYRAPEGDDRTRRFARRSGAMQTEIDFDRSARFFCGARESEGRVGLFFSCENELRLDGQACVTRKETIRRADAQVLTTTRRQSVAKLFDVAPDSCRTLESALNFVADRTRPDRNDSLRAYFGAR